MSCWGSYSPQISWASFLLFSHDSCAARSTAFANLLAAFCFLFWNDMSHWGWRRSPLPYPHLTRSFLARCTGSRNYLMCPSFSFLMSGNFYLSGLYHCWDIFGSLSRKLVFIRSLRLDRHIAALGGIGFCLGWDGILEFFVSEWFDGRVCMEGRGEGDWGKGLGTRLAWRWECKWSDEAVWNNSGTFTRDVVTGYGLSVQPKFLGAWRYIFYVLRYRHRYAGYLSLI